MAGLEPTASWSRTKRSTKLSHISIGYEIGKRKKERRKRKSRTRSHPAWLPGFSSSLRSSKTWQLRHRRLVTGDPFLPFGRQDRGNCGRNPSQKPPRGFLLGFRKLSHISIGYEIGSQNYLEKATMRLYARVPRDYEYITGFSFLQVFF